MSSEQTQETVKSSDEIIVNILRGEIEKTLKSVVESKFQHTLTADVFNDYVSSGLDQLLKIYSQDPQDVTTKNDDNNKEKTESISIVPSQNLENEVELKSVLNILALNSQQILDRVLKESQIQLKKQIELPELIKILSALPNDEESSSDEDKNDDDEEDEEDVDEEEEYVGMTEEELSTLIAEAFDNIRRVGRSDGQRLARSVRDAFCEINGREPELREIASVFTRIKDKLAEEAKEDGDSELLSSSRNIIIKDDVTNVDENVESAQQAKTPIPEDKDKDNKEVTKKLGVLNFDIGTATKEEKEELLKFARNLVRDDLEGQAKKQLSKLIGREPTKQELNDMLIQLATTSLLDCNFDSSDDASDYNPNTNDEQQLLANDNEETAQFDDDNSRETEEPTLIDKPVLTTPVKNKGNSSRVDYYFEKYSDDCSQLYINQAISSFKKLHNREPNDEEKDKMKHFLHTEKANLLSDPKAEIDEADKENTSFKLNFGADDTIDVE